MSRGRSLLWVLLGLVIAVVGPTRAAESPKPLLVAAASDLKFALDEILVEFRKANPDLDAKTTYGSSGTLYAQIDNGAPYDLFLSADVRFPLHLIERGKADADSLFQYAIGHLVVWVPKESKLDVTKLEIKTVLDPAVRKVAIANPDVAPYGAGAVAALKSLGVHEAIRSKLVLGENIAQTAQFVQSAAADVGIISLSLAVAPRMRDTGRYWQIPSEAYPPIAQAGVIREGAANRDGALKLGEFLRSATGREIVRRYGFTIPETGK